MKKKEKDMPKLTKNEQEVLKNIIFQAKTPDTEIARKLKLTQQAVFKIRHKLEETGIIEGYMPIINYKKIGIHMLVIMAVRVRPLVWKNLSNEEVSEKLRQIPYVMHAYRIPDSDVSHVLIMGFRDVEQKDRFLMRLQTNFAEEIEIKSVYPFSVERIITQNPVGLLTEVLDKKDFRFRELFLEKKE